MKKLLFLIFSFFLVGCAGGPKASVEEDLQAKRFTIPKNNTSNLYIYRNELLAIVDMVIVMVHVVGVFAIHQVEIKVIVNKGY